MIPSKELIQKASLVADKTFSEIHEGQSWKRFLTFDPAWCQAYFILSDNKDSALHGLGGMRLVQGSALVTRLDGFVSECMLGWTAKRLDLNVSRPLYVNDSIFARLLITCKGGGARVVGRLTVESGLGEKILDNKEIIFAHPRVLQQYHYPVE